MHTYVDTHACRHTLLSELKRRVESAHFDHSFLPIPNYPSGTHNMKTQNALISQHIVAHTTTHRHAHKEFKNIMNSKYLKKCESVVKYLNAKT